MTEFLKFSNSPCRKAKLQTVEQFISLQIADALGDRDHASAYVSESQRTSSAGLIAAYRMLKAAVQPNAHLPTRDLFSAATKELNSGSTLGLNPSVIAIRLSRRRVACSVFSGLALEYAQLRELPSDTIGADAALAHFVCKLIERHPQSLVAIEERRSGFNRPGILHDQLLELVRAAAMPISIVETRTLFTAFSDPPSTARSNFRNAVATVWPGLLIRFQQRIVLDAVGLGLFVQVRRFLEQEDSQEGAG